MLYALPDSAGDILVIQAADNLTQDDYLNVFLPQIAKQLKPNRKLRVLLYLDHSVIDIEQDSTWQPERFFSGCDSEILRLAIVADTKWQKTALNFDITKTQYFEVSGFLKALHWLDEPQT
jgi:hypothetical protein